MRAAERPEIARLPLFAGMNEMERERIFGGSFLQAFPPQLTLFDIGQRADFLHVLVDGLVELFASGGGVLPVKKNFGAGETFANPLRRK